MLNFIFREEIIHVGGKKIRLVGEVHIVPPGLRSRIEQFVMRGDCVAVEGIDKKSFPEILLVLVYAPLKVLVHLRLLGAGAIMTSMRLAKEGKVCLHKLEEGHRPSPREKIEVGMLAGLILLAYVNLIFGPVLMAVHVFGTFLLLELVIFMVAWPVFERFALLRATWLIGPGILFARNEVMARRLLQLIEENKVGDEVTVIVGRAHLGHLKKRLLAKSGV